MRTLIIILCALITLPAFAGSRAKRTDGITRTGDVLQLAIPISALAYSSYIQDWEGAKQLGFAYGATFATTQVLKYTIREERPYQADGVKGTTFPSGHTSSAFAGAGYWQMRYGWYVGAPMYATAAFVGYSRNHANMHNWLDIATGAVIGIGFNILFTSRYNNESAQLSVSPTQGAGAKLNFNTKF
ncbi:MAG: phosphatase PAP2 family protein [Alphaproteobacteria bacterium]|nr:phosphatase PAP2 family protein [Alphaproteobacteria bacterium]